ncbi:MAG: septal ring lytic transglycosylase RlpA family protein [Pseudomonadota bacterium]
MNNDSPLLEPFDLSIVKPVEPRREVRTVAGNKSPYTVNGRTYKVLSDETGYNTTGTASWYGRKFHGHLTSNGEVYDMFQLSAAHTTLPIPSYIRVTNLDNGKSIIARVNDRGPFHTGRVVDLSYAGAVMLGYAGQGTARVKVEAVLPGEEISSAPQPVQPVITQASPIEVIAEERQKIDANEGREFLQVGAFSSLEAARTLVSRLNKFISVPVSIQSDTAQNGNLLHKVRIGPVSDALAIEEIINGVQSAGLGTPFKVRI